MIIQGKLYRQITKVEDVIFCPFVLSSVFGSVVVVAFQIAFRAEIHVNDVFSFFKNHF
jgi:hypothetical protein